jgi:hypothetical protein
MTAPLIATNLATIPQVRAWATAANQMGASQNVNATFATATFGIDGTRPYGRRTLVATTGIQGLSYRNNDQALVGAAQASLPVGAGIPCAGKTRVRLNCKYRVTVASGVVVPIAIEWRFADAAYAWVNPASTSTPVINLVNGQWVEVNLVLPVPANGAFLAMRWFTQHAAANVAQGDTADIAEVLFTTDDYDGPYFDGDADRARWTGAVNNSTSELFGDAPPQPLPPPPSDVSCIVYVEGNRIADTGPDYLNDVPTVLAGLSVEWGRETVVDQPPTSTCSFTVAERPGMRSIFPVLHVGNRVDVEVGYQDESIPPGAPVNVAEDGNFLTIPISQRTRYGTGSVARAVLGGNVTMLGVQSGSIYARTTRSLPAAFANDMILIAPAAFSNQSTAWDSIPQVLPGSSWQLQFYAGMGGNGDTGSQTPGQYYPQPLAQAVLFTSPSATGPYSFIGPQVTLESLNNLQWTINVPIPTPLPQRGWLGLAVWPRPRITWERYWSATAPWTGALDAWVGATGYNPRGLDDLRISFFQVITTGGADLRRQMLAFAGRITDLEIVGAQNGSSQWRATCADVTADMANDAIGDDPWQQERIDVRVPRIQSLSSVDFTTDIDSGIAHRVMSYIDVDSQPTIGLITDMANSSGGIVWAAFTTERGFYLWIEDPENRVALGALMFDANIGRVVIDWNRYHPGGSAIVSACDIPRDAPSFVQNVSDVITRVDLTWLEQTMGEDGVTPEPTERYVHVWDSDAEALYGVRALSMSTQLVNSTAATDVATQALMRQSDLRWRMLNIEWDTGTRVLTDADRTYLLRILDGVTRIGLPVTITDLPAWTPDYPAVNAYLEGGTYTYTDGAWTVDLNLSPSHTIGASATWAQLPVAWRWNQFDINIAWSDCWGLAVSGTALAVQDEPVPVITDRLMGSSYGVNGN